MVATHGDERNTGAVTAKDNQAFTENADSDRQLIELR